MTSGRAKCRVRRSLAYAMWLAALFGPSLAAAQAHLLSATDALLRADVALLVDEGVIRLPTSTWPVPASDVLEELDRVNVDLIAEPALQAALVRVRDKVALPSDAAEWRLRDLRVTAGEPGLLRSYDTLARASLEVESSGGATNDRWSLKVAVTGVASPEDDRNLRLDGTAFSVRWGNWLSGANQVGRWWGPGWDGSLILSTNARPMPGLSLDRIRSEPFDFPVLRLLGPWRFTGFIGRADGGRPDVNDSLFMGMRVAFKPAQIVEVALSRSAQFCGNGRTCDLRTFRNVLFGNDNVGLRVSLEDEPGNQMAGADIRVTSPFRSLPFAIYAQLIGEDNSSTGIPERYLGLFGLETWALLDSGAAVRSRLEYANTRCKFDTGDEGADCAYRQTIFFAGYRYRGRNIGHTTDADSESVALAVSLTRPRGDQWSLRLRRALFDRVGNPDPYNPVSQMGGEGRSAELGWQGELFGQLLSAQLGVERNDRGTGEFNTRGYGFLQWQKAL